MKRAAETIQSRLRKLGLAAHVTHSAGTRLLVVRITAPRRFPVSRLDPVEARGIFEIYDLETSLQPPSISITGRPVETASLYDLLAAVAPKPNEGSPSAYYLFDKRKRLLSGPAQTTTQLFTRGLRSVPPGGKVLAVPHNTVVLHCAWTNPVCPGHGPSGVINSPPKGTIYYYLFKHDLAHGVPQLTGEDLIRRATRAGLEANGAPQVDLSFTHKGGRMFQKITRAEWARGRIRNSPQHFAIVLDNEIESFPQIDYTDLSLSKGISGASGRIVGLGSVTQAKELAAVLGTGTLAYTFVRVSARWR